MKIKIEVIVVLFGWMNAERVNAYDVMSFLKQQYPLRRGIVVGAA